MEAADKTEKAGKPAKKDEAKVRKYVCVQKCFYDGRLFYEDGHAESLGHCHKAHEHTVLNRS